MFDIADLFKGEGVASTRPSQQYVVVSSTKRARYGRGRQSESQDRIGVSRREQC